MLNAQPTRRMLNVTETQSNRQAQKGVIMSINAGQNQKGKTRHNSHLMPPSIIYDNILFCIQFARFICLLSDSHFALLSQQVATTSRRKSLIKSGVLKKSNRSIASDVDGGIFIERFSHVLQVSALRIGAFSVYYAQIWVVFSCVTECRYYTCMGSSWSTCRNDGVYKLHIYFV